MKSEPTISVIVCGKDNFHPYECDPGYCIHCNGEKTQAHDPNRCALCRDGEQDAGVEMAPEVDPPLVSLRR